MPSTGRADFALLATLDEFGSLSQADLGRHLGLDRNDINGVVTRLEAAGHIARRTDPEDRRRNIVELSIAGSAYLDDLQARADDVQRELLAGLSATEEQQLIALLDKLLVAHGAQSA
jgi:DNA-binding MarR family transcriptional regulator